MSTINQSPLHYDTQQASAEPRYGGFTVQAWLMIGTITALMVTIFWYNLTRLWGKTNPINGEGEWGHAIIVPVLGLYFLYLNRDELLKEKVEPLLLTGSHRGRFWGAAGVLIMAAMAYVLGPIVVPSQGDILQKLAMGLVGLAGMVVVLNWGIATMLFGLAFFAYGIYPGQNDYFKDLGMVATIFGVVLTLCGWGVMRVAWFPIVFLICALPWPGLFYSWVAGPLQVLAAKAAVLVLQLSGVDAFQSGTKINMGARVLNVAEACAGLKSLMTFVTIGAAIAFLSTRPMWQKLFLVAMAVPVAIACNVIRVAGQGLLDHYVSQELSENFAHQFVGLVMVIPALFILLGLGWVLDQLFIEEADEDTARAAAIANKASTGETMVGASPDVMIAPKRATPPTATAPSTPAPNPATAAVVTPTAVPSFIPPGPTRLPPRPAKPSFVPPSSSSTEVHSEKQS